MKVRMLGVVGLAVVAGMLPGCLSRNFNTAQTASEPSSCSTAFNVASFVNQRKSCYAERIESRRNLYSWIPCNHVQVFAHADDARETNAGTQAWLKDAKPFSSEVVARMFASPGEAAAESAGFPVLQSPIHKALVGLIRDAKETLFVDVFLLGGYWGVEIVRELVKASQERGVKVLVVRDVENPFSFRTEIDPLMMGMVSHSRTALNFVAMRAQIHKRPSFLPVGLDNLLKPFFKNTDQNNTPTLQSDHSKILVADGFTEEPKMLVGSRNMTDFGATVNFDEILRVDGPAAGAALLTYLPDVAQALDLAKEEGQISPVGEAYVKEWLAEARARLSGDKPSLAKPAGSAEVRIAENNGDDSVRNAEHTIINLLESARSSIRFYGMGMIPYSLEFTKAMARAVKRGVRFQSLLDSRMGLMTGTAFLEQVRDQAGLARIEDIEARWRVLLPVEKMADGRPDLAQQQHTKTILIDDQILFAGSANQDAATFEGAFREFSVAVRGSDAVAQSVANFKAVFDDPLVSKPLGAYTAAERGVVGDALDGFKRRALFEYLRVRGMRVNLVEAAKTQPGCE